MSGIVGSNLNIKGAGLVAKLGTDGQVLTSAGAGVAAAFEDVAGGLTWQSVVTGSTLSAVAGNGYWIDTTSNACTITLPAAATNGDEIMFVDFNRTWGTNGIEIDSNGLNYQGDADTSIVEYSTDGQNVLIVYSDATKGWIPTLDQAVADVPVTGNDNGIFAFGHAGGTATGVSNIVSNVGVVATDVSAVGSARWAGGGCEYGGDKGIFGYGYSPALGQSSLSNLVSNTGVIGTDVTGVGTGRSSMSACSFGGDQGIFYAGNGPVGMTNIVSNAGVVATDVSGVGTAVQSGAGCEYGTDTGILAYGNSGSDSSLSHLVSTVGVVSADVAGVGTARDKLAACTYSYDKGIFAYGQTASVVSLSNLVSNTGVIATDVTGVGTARQQLAATQYGQDKGIFAYGAPNGEVSMSNLVSNAGVIATDTTGVGSVRQAPMACSYN